VCLVVFANTFIYTPNIKYMHFCGFQFKYTYTKGIYANTYPIRIICSQGQAEYRLRTVFAQLAICKCSIRLSLF